MNFWGARCTIWKGTTPVGLGTELSTFKGNDRIALVLPSTDSHLIILYPTSVPENAFRHVYERERDKERTIMWHDVTPATL